MTKKKMRLYLADVHERLGDCYWYDITNECFCLIIKALMETDIYTETEKAIITRQFCEGIVTVDYVLKDII